MQRSLLDAIVNTHLGDRAWLQASLPIEAGGLGILNCCELVPWPTSLLWLPPLTLLATFPVTFQVTAHVDVGDALSFWSQSIHHPPPEVPASHHQKAWDICKVSATVMALPENALNTPCQACLLVASMALG